MTIKRFNIGWFVFTELEEGFYSVYHPVWEWCERIDNGKRIIRLKAKDTF